MPLLTMRVKKNYDRYKYYFRVNDEHRAYGSLSFSHEPLRSHPDLQEVTGAE